MDQTKNLLSSTPIVVTDGCQLERLLDQFAFFRGRLIGHLLVAMGVVDQDDVEALEASRMGGSGRAYRIGELLIQKDIIDPAHLEIALAAQAGKPWLDISHYVIPPELIELIPHEMSCASRALPLHWRDGELIVGKESVSDDLFDAQLRAVAQSRITSVGCSKPTLKLAAQRNYGGLVSEVEALRPEDSQQASNLSNDELWMSSKRIFLRAAHMGASDIHLTPDHAGYRQLFRLNGGMTLMEKETTDRAERRISQIKAIADMDISAVRGPQDGKLRLFSSETTLDLRISSMPTVHGESIAIRLLDQSKMFTDIAEVGYQPEDVSVIKRMLTRQSGLMLVSGPTGSGKSTTLYASMAMSVAQKKNVLTIEDPVEYVIDGAQQIEVDESRGRSFASILRNILRHDPDCCMVGEIRDEDTARTVGRAAMSGRMVLSTVHSSDAISAVLRMLDLGLPSIDLSFVLNGIVAQRLVPKLCPHCRQSIVDSQYYLKGDGCGHCYGKGDIGRILVYEVLVMTKDVEMLFRSKQTRSSIRDRLVNLGFVTMEQRAIDLAIRGEISANDLFDLIEPQGSSSIPKNLDRGIAWSPTAAAPR